jgi:pyruvate kinase
MWQSMVNSIKELEQEIGKKIKIYMDLSGPKLRTSEINLIGRKGKVKNSIRVKVGEHIILAKDLNGYSDTASQNKKKHKKKVVEVMLHEVIEDAQIGEKVLFDDGMIRSTIVDKKEDYLELEITACYKEKIGSHKGINLPNTQLNLPALTEKDIEDLPFACKYADLIGYSFVRTPEDVNTLYRQLDKNKARDLGIVFKIENEQAFKNLPGILIKGMERNNIGVMIARGDLAVEIGFERISEVQNQILLICEAAHIPAIWATQVLENLAKTGIPTRAEISDVVLSAQAECVMLNKGDYILNAIQVLKNILHRVEGQSFKNKNELRALNVAQEFTKKL